MVARGEYFLNISGCIGRMGMIKYALNVVHLGTYFDMSKYGRVEAKSFGKNLQKARNFFIFSS